jgi:hypothetical protein
MDAKSALDAYGLHALSKIAFDWSAVNRESPRQKQLGSVKSGYSRELQRDSAQPSGVTNDALTPFLTQKTCSNEM